jgi:predicted nucleic acid-binding protein
VRLVVADTGPVHYLVLIGPIGILPALFERVLVPSVVRDELANAEAPAAVRYWIENPPAWLEVREAASGAFDASLHGLDEGEKAVIDLAASLGADLLLMDDREGVTVARRKGLAVNGTLGILSLAAHDDLLDLADAFNRLKRTNFYYPQDVMDALIAKHKRDQ